MVTKFDCSRVFPVLRNGMIGLYLSTGKECSWSCLWFILQCAGSTNHHKL